VDPRYFVAGGTCAAISHGITTPIDVVKTKIQAQPDRFQSKSIPQAAVDIIQTEGPPALLGGLGPTVVGYGIEGAMKFGIYEVMKPVFAALLQNIHGGSSDTQGVAFLLASVVAGAVAALFLCPMESTRIRMVTDPAYANLKFLGAWTKLIHEEGLASTFAGVWAMISKQVRIIHDVEVCVCVCVCVRVT
jgi:solute carrier family 25 phosphate transporter 3